jgi:FKBP-type peptidyl-prolyl cis-trans isomerase FklB
MTRFSLVLGVLLAASTLAAHAADPALSPQANQAFLADYGKKPGVYKRTSGIEYRILQNGFGARPNSTDIVTVYYKGQLINGKVFDATEPGFPAEFPVNNLIPGWTEALQLMREGDHWQLVIPANLAYGTRGAGDAIPPNQTLVFDMTLVKVTHPDKDKEKEDSDNSGQ